MRKILAIGALGLTLLLGACGNLETESSTDLFGASLVDRFRGTDAGPDVRTLLTPALVAGSPTSALLVVQLKEDLGFIVTPFAANLGTVQWESASGAALLRRNGLLVGTRGFGHDLLTANLSGLNAALAAGGGSDVLRVNRVINDSGVIERRDYLCDVRLVGSEVLEFYGKRSATRVFEEDCRAGGGDFVNRYWVESDGNIRRSRERITSEAGDIDVLRLTE